MRAVDRWSSGWRALAVITVVKIAVGIAVWSTGFRAISDDDYARVVIAQEWLSAPKLDPTGTSWLPVPFWLTGSLMALLGSGLDAARAIALGQGVLSMGLVYAAARWMVREPSAALMSTLVACVLPWSARLGVATVPELPTAALALFAIASACPEPGARSMRAPWLGGIALFFATLSRYEPWTIAAGFFLLAMRDALRDPARRGRLVGGAIASVLGPLAWLVHNAVAHGSALHFVERVSAYKRALGESWGSPLEQFLGYPGALLGHEGEFFAFLVVLAIAVRWIRGPMPTLISQLAPHARAVGLALVSMVLLSVASVRDGAPTHHPERALLVVLLLCALPFGPLLLAFWRARPKRAAVAVTAALLVLIPVLTNRFSWVLGQPGAFADRQGEEAIGRALARSPYREAPVLVQATDYGFYAVMAAATRPELEVDRSIDPRERTTSSSFRSAEALAARLDELETPYFVVTDGAPTWQALPHRVILSSGRVALVERIDATPTAPSP